MKLEDFLSLIQDDEARIELEIDEAILDLELDGDYHYHHFWLSDFLTSLDTAKYYDYEVTSFSFLPEKESYAKIRIQIRQSYA